jgi:antitoxin component YwqK of YwqJK toxin-antitoxin module
MKDDKKEGKEIGFYKNGKMKYERFYLSDMLEGKIHYLK